MNLFPILDLSVSETVVERLGWVLVHSLWQFSIAALLVGALVRTLRHGSAATRYGALVTTLAVMVAAPVATWILLPGGAQLDQASGVMTVSRGSIDALTNRRADATPLAGQLNLARGAIESDTLPNVPASRLPSDQLPAASPSPASNHAELTWPETTKTALQPWLPWIVIGWSLGVVICSLRPLLGWHTLRRLQRVGVSPVSDDVRAALLRVSARLGLRHTARVLQSTLAQVPVVVGYLRPVVLLPVSLLTTIPAAQLEAILAHELAHVRRHDFVVNLLQTLIETLFFYHPAVWWLSRQIRIEREHCCDDLVVKLFGNRVEYGRALVAIEEMRTKSFVLALSAGDGSLLSRIRRLVHATEHDRLPVWWQSPMATLVVVAGIIVASWSLTRATDDPLASAESLPNAPEIRTDIRTEVDLPAAGPEVVRTVRGVVQDSDRRRAAGITVVLRTQSAGIASTTHAPEPGTNLADTVSDADGRFEFKGVRIQDRYDGDMRDGRTMPLDVIAFAAGRAIGWTHAAGPGEVKLDLNPTARLHGIVRNAAGLPVVGADVSVKYLMSIRHIAQADLEQGRWPRSDDRQFINLADSPSTRVASLTDENGRFELGGLPADSGLLLEVRHADYQITNAYAATVEKLDPENQAAAKRDVQVGDMQIALERGHHVAVQVVFDDTGEPAAFAKLPIPPRAYPPQGTADPEGRFEFRHLVNGKFGLYVYAPDESEYLAVRQTVELIADTYEHDVAVRLPRGVVLTGRVIDEKTQKGISGARLVWWSPERENVPPAQKKAILSGQFLTDDAGAFRVPVATGPVNVAISSTVEGYRPIQPYNYDFERSDPRLLRSIEVATNAKPEPVVFTLTRGSSRHGIVYDPEGKPASNVEFAGRILRGPNTYRNFRRKTGEDGTFELPDLFQVTPEDDERASVFVGFRDPQRSLGGVVEVYPHDDPQKPVEVQLWANSAVRGRLIDRATGEAIRDMRVWVHAYPGGSRMALEFMVVGPTSTNKDGEFSLSGLVPGVLYRVLPDNRDYIMEDNRSKLTAATDETDLGDLLLTPRAKADADKPLNNHKGVAARENVPANVPSKPDEKVGDKSTDIAEIVRPLLPSIVLIMRTNPETGRPEPNPNWQAGIVVDERGYILTTWTPDFGRARQITVRLVDQSEYVAEAVATDKKLQLAVLRIRRRWPLKAISLSKTQAPKAGDPVIGVPSPAQTTSLVGTVIAVGANMPTLPPNLIQSDLPLPIGEAGSLMVTDKGDPAGIWWGIRAGKIRTSFAVPLQDVLPLLAKSVPHASTDTSDPKHGDSNVDKADDHISPSPPVEKATAEKAARPADNPPKTTVGDLLAAMIKQPSLAVLKQLLAAAGTKQPEPVELLDDGRMERVKKGSIVKLIGDGSDQIAIVSARVRPIIGDEGGIIENDFSRLPECAVVFDNQGRLIATLGGKIGTSRANSPSPERVEILSLGPVEDWFVRVTRFEYKDAFEFQSEYYRIATPVVQSLRYFHYANSNPWSFGPEKFSRFGTLYFDFPRTSDKLARLAVGLTPDGVGVNPIIIWDGDRNRFVGAVAQRANNKPLYQVDTEWSRDFEPLVPKPDQFVVSGGARREEHWHSWYTVVPDKFEAVVMLTIPQREGPPKAVRRTCRPGATVLTLHDTPDGDVLAASLVLHDLAEKRETFELPHPLGERPATHPPNVQVLNPGESAQLLARPLATSSEALIVEIRLQSQGTSSVK